MFDLKQGEGASETSTPGAGKHPRATMSVVEAGYELGVGKNKAYELAKQGVIPTIKLGDRARVPVQFFFNRLLKGEI